MNIERITNVKYIVTFTESEAMRVKIIAEAFTHGNSAASLSSIFEEGLEVNEAIEKMLSDEEYRNVTLMDFADRTLTKVDEIRAEGLYLGKVKKHPLSKGGT